MKSRLTFILGAIVFGMGTLFALQGSDVMHWPPESTMVGNRDWTEYGIVIAMAGLALMLTARRIRR